ncbi:MAG: PaREP1 family protein [Pyrobaculum sp.]
MDFPTLAKPWRDLGLYIRAREREALVEARLALEFLGDGLIRNAAGKAFQAWKAHLATPAAKHKERLAREYPGSRRIRAGEDEVVVKEVDLVIALMPTTQMVKAAKALAEAEGGDVFKYTMLAMQLHRYQYNGPDPELSDFPDDKSAAYAVCLLLGAFAEKIDIYPSICRAGGLPPSVQNS